MKPLVDFVTNLTVVAVFQLIFNKQDYQIINFYSNDSNNDVLNKLMQIASDSFKPFNYMNIETISSQRKSFSGRFALNILAVNEIKDIKALNKTYLDDVTVIWSTSNYDDLNFSSGKWLRLSAKVMILTNSFLFTINMLDDKRFEKISLSPFRSTSITEHLDDYFSIQSAIGSNLTIFMEVDPPKSDLTKIGNDYCIIGPDGNVAETLVTSLNVTPIFYTNVKRKRPQYKEWLNSPILSSRLRHQYHYEKLLTKNVLTIFNYSGSSHVDLQLTSLSHQGKYFFKGNASSTETLYPHDIDCLAVIVPQRKPSNDFLRRVISNADIQAICIALSLFIMLRIILDKANWRQSFIILIRILGVFFNQDKIKNKSQIQTAWDVNLRAFSILAVTSLSAIIFKSLIEIQRVEINTVDDLLASNLTIYAPHGLKHQETWEHIRPNLRAKIEFQSENFIENNLVNERKFNFGYLYHKANAEYIVMLANANVQEGECPSYKVRLMKQDVYCGLESYRIAKQSPLKSYVQKLVQRFIESGLYHKHLEWLNNLNLATLQVNQKKPELKKTIVLTTKMMYEVFILYVIGVTLAVICFVIEIIYFKYSL